MKILGIILIVAIIGLIVLFFYKLKDKDGDGDIDLFITGFSLLILLNDGNGNFIDGTNTFPEPLSGIGTLFTSEIYDVNHDGSPDILAACECLKDSAA